MQSAEFLEGSINDLSAVLRGHYEIGLRILGIAYNLPNAFGSGNFYPYMELTSAGRGLVEEIHKLDMILDVGGHTGEQTSLDAIAMAPEIPVICSHTNVGAIADNPRCVSDRLIDAIAGTGGVIGLTAVNDFHVRGRGELDVAHSPRIGLDQHIDQMDYLRHRVGVDHIGVGPDFVDGRGLDYDLYNRTVSINRSIISDGPWLYLEGFEDISELPNVVAKMHERGWSSTDIDKVMGGNWLRVYEEVWGK
jgi:membrane dipeptidase